ncbi:uncharacterized protein [Halyomorpha halys]|uniref:uncharacterized protein n=1 Tax=Halyomorpha halys TaxID=286706 RepID=UPI0034D188E2
MSGYISVLLQKSSATGDWGFLLGAEPPSPNVIVTQVDTRCVAAELLEPGDRVIELEGMEANRLTQEEMNEILKSPSNRLSMVLLKRYVGGSRRNLYSSFTRKEEKTEEISSREEKKSQTETTGDYNYYELSSQTTRKEQKHDHNNKKDEEQSNTKTGVFKAKPYNDETQKRNDLFEVKTKEHFSSQEKKYCKEEEHLSSTNNIREETLRKELVEMEEKKKMSSSFWTDPPKDLKSAIANAKFWKSPGGSFVSTSSIFSQLNNISNQQKKIDPREEKRQFWENCSKGRMGTDSPGSKSDGGERNGEGKVEDVRSKSCEPENLKTTNPFHNYQSQNIRNNSPSNPFFNPSPTNPFYNTPKDSSAHTTVDEYSSTESKFTESLQEEEKVIEENTKVKSEHTNLIKSSETSDFTANREFFERATSVPIISCVKNAQDLVSERLSPSMHSKLKKPSDFINKVRADATRSKSLQPEDSAGRKETREKSVMREMPNEYYSPTVGSIIDRDVSIESDAANRRFTTTTYEKVTRVGTPYENMESAWRREYRVATPSGFYDNNFEEIFKEESYMDHGPPVRAVPPKNGAEEAVEEAFRELTMREGLEPGYGCCCECK